MLATGGRAANGTITIGGSGGNITQTAGDGGTAINGSISNTGGNGGSHIWTTGIGGIANGTLSTNGTNGKFIWKSGTTEIARMDNTVGSFLLNLDINTTGKINTKTNFSVNNIQGKTINTKVLADANLTTLVKKYCWYNYTGGILTSTDCPTS